MALGVYAAPHIQKWEIQARIEKTRRGLLEEGFDGLVVIGRSFYDRPGPLAYLTNHFPPFPSTVVSGEVRGMGHGILFIPREGSPTLLIDAKAYRRDLVAISDVRGNHNLSGGLLEVLKERGLTEGRIGLVGEDLLPLSLFRDLERALPGITWQPAEALVSHQMRIKSPAEQALLRQAACVAGEGLKAALASIGPGVRENQVCAAGIAAAIEAGADFVRYLRVHSGEWSAWGARWPQAMDREIRKGELVTLDIIGACRGYQFDVLRTTPVGEPSKKQQEVLDIVLHALEALKGAARPGVKASELVKAARAIIEERGYGPFSSSFVGHGIGLETVEEPYLLPGVDMELEEGMVLCLEPGIYIPEWGGCSIEEEVIITAKGAEQITDLPARLW